MTNTTKRKINIIILYILLILFMIVNIVMLVININTKNELSNYYNTIQVEKAE